MINWICSLVMLAMAAAPGLAQGQPRSLFADQKAAHIGDALTVIIQENASATNSAETTTEKSNALNVGSNVPQGGGNLLDFVPLHSLQSDASSGFEGRVAADSHVKRHQKRARKIKGWVGYLIWIWVIL